MTKKQQPAHLVNTCFIVVGYGIPKDILQDQNYDFYLRTIFNKIFDICSISGNWNPVILFSGGKTDMWKPYRRIEAQEMKKAFLSLMQRPAVKAQTKGWKIVLEPKSLSTLDNFLYAKEVLDQKQLYPKKIAVFCEQTRAARVKVLARTFFKRADVHPIDFDQSANRYLDPKKLQRLAKEALKFDLWALESAEHLAKHQALFKEKIQFLRDAGPDAHVEAVRQWWEKQLEKVDAGR